MKIIRHIIGFAGLFMFPLLVLSGCGATSDGPDTPSPKPGTEKPKIEVAPGNDLYGMVSDASGKAMGGVVVSDGYQCVVTDSKGVYQSERVPAGQQGLFQAPERYGKTLRLQAR